MAGRARPIRAKSTAAIPIAASGGMSYAGPGTNNSLRRSACSQHQNAGRTSADAHFMSTRGDITGTPGARLGQAVPHFGNSVAKMYNSFGSDQ